MKFKNGKYETKKEWEKVKVQIEKILEHNTNLICFSCPYLLQISCEFGINVGKKKKRGNFS